MKSQSYLSAVFCCNQIIVDYEIDSRYWGLKEFMIKSFVFLIHVKYYLNRFQYREIGIMGCEKKILEFSKNSVRFSCAWEYIKKTTSFKRASKDQRELIEK